MRTLSKPGDKIAEDHGHLRITRQMSICGGITIYVHCGPTEVPELGNHFPRGRFTAARIWWHEIAQAADAYLPEHLIVARLQALTAAGRAITVSEERK